MKNRKKVVIYLVFLIDFVCYTLLLGARVQKVRSDNKFYDRIMKRQLAVAMFYKEDKETRKDKDLREKVNRLERMFSVIGKQGYYKEGGVSFVKANSKYDMIKELAESFSITTLPAFLLFKNGVHLKDKKGNPIILAGWPTFEQVEDFIRGHFEKDIEKNIRRRAERLRRLREAQRMSYLYYRPYFYGGWPYWGYGSGWGWYGGWGGRRCCW